MDDRAGARTISRRIKHGSGAGATARELVLDLLADHPTTDELRHDAALVAFELVANAADHGRPDAAGTVLLTCRLVDDVLTVEVRDAGSHGRAEPHALEDEVDHGRGLAIVDALSSSWRVDHSEGTVVTAEVPLVWRAPTRS
jgi:anti-sigma regulatory factor (Ser/Thr protein kinase)